MVLIFLAIGCPNITDGTKPTDDSGTTGTVDTGPTGTDETGSTVDTGAPAATVGPDLPACTPQSGSGDTVALSGVVLAPDGPIAGLVVYARSTGQISCVGDCPTTGAEVICTEGIISPGLIDAHNHLQYNSLPPWQVDPEFTDRYDWQSDGRYYDYRTAFDVVASDYKCEIMKWAELRELVHGTTSAVGSSGGDCIDVLIRDLDAGSSAHFISGYDIEYSSSNVTDSVNATDGASYAEDLASGSLDAVLMHVAEGKDGSVRDEIDHMFDAGMTGPGQVYVHTTDASTEQLARMALDGTGIVWSPRSNLALYGTTTPIEIAEALGVPWALGTDWTPSGSMAPMRELECASQWLASKGYPLSDIDLWRKSTSDAARIVGLDGVLGELAEGYRADIAVYDWSRTPYQAIITGGPETVRLTVVNGSALYGRTDWLATTTDHPEWCETLDACGAANSVCVKVASSGDDAQTYGEIEATLTAAMAGTVMPSGYAYAAALYPVLECTDTRPACDLRVVTARDADGDGISDDSDDCPDAYDPAQWDTDSDGIGDSCDDCPITAGEDCATGGSDVDGDGIVNDVDNCPYTGNADQADTDADGVGDVCDACEGYDDAVGGCPTTIDAVRDPANPAHPEEGSSVTLEGLVVTGINPDQGFFVQDQVLPEYAGIYVYAPGEAAPALGDVVTLIGTYTEYYGMSELTGPTVTVTGTAALPEARLVSPCDIGTAGPLAEPLEGMLAQVEDVSVTDDAPDKKDYDEFVVGNCLRIDDFLYEDLDQSAEGTAYYLITGIVGYTFDNNKLFPRDATDLLQ